MQSKLSLSPETSLQDEGVKASLKLGLFSYPVLQAADVLVHRATHVPVGDDQRQHLEFARECVSNFNTAYGRHLIPPETITSKPPNQERTAASGCRRAKRDRSSEMLTSTAISNHTSRHVPAAAYQENVQVPPQP